MGEKDEWQFETSYALTNRLKTVAIENRQAAIKGLPVLEDEDGRTVMQMALAVRGVTKKKQLEAWGEGTLQLLPQKLKLQKMASGWRGNQVMKENWAAQSTHGSAAEQAEEDEGEEVEAKRSIKRNMPLTEIACPRCEAKQSTERLKLQTKAGFSNLMCKRCEEATSSSRWKCRCRIPWIKCPIHVHVRKKLARGIKEPATRRSKGATPSRGVDVQMPTQRVIKAKVDIKNLRLHGKPAIKFHTPYFKENEIRRAVNRIRLEPGSKLAARFPHLVQMAAPT